MFMKWNAQWPSLGIVAVVLTLMLGCGSDGNQDADVAASKADASAAMAGMIARGEEIYKANCIACHGAGGKGDGPAAGALKPPPRDHTDRAYMDTLSDQDLRTIIVMGGAIKGRPLMPSHPQIRGAELDALVAYVRSLSAGGT